VNTSPVNNVIISIQEQYDNLRPSEKKVADYIRANPADIIHLSIAELSALVGVSEPTVIRFCRNIGYSGFQNFKIEFAQSNPLPLKIIHEELTPDDSISDIAQKVVNSHIIALTQTLEALNFGTLSGVADVLSQSAKIDFYGLGGSGTAAQDAENKFIRTKLNTYPCVDAHVQLMRGSLMGPDDSIVIFSNSGHTIHYTKLLEITKKNGVRSVVITSHKNSPVALLADHVIEIQASEIQYRKEPSSARMAMLAVIDIIVAAIALKNHSAYIENIMTTRKAIDHEKL
jgi:DNA-binding MurR/RpiR family transcriptional regulator